jgi:hypothetical protein
MKKALLFIAVSLPAFAAHAQVYKCVDAAGKTLYSQIPCPANAKALPMTWGSAPAAASGPATPAAADASAAKETAGVASGVATGAAPGAAAGANAGAAAGIKATGPKTPVEQEQAFRKRLQEQQEAAKKENEKVAQSKAREENCGRAREQLVQMEAGGRIARVNAQGERYFLEDQQISQETARARSLVSQWCN